jgi:hypothetical protein
MDTIPPRRLETPPPTREFGPPWEVSAGIQHWLEQAEAAIAVAEERDEVEQGHRSRRHALNKSSSDPCC